MWRLLKNRYVLLVIFIGVVYFNRQNISNYVNNYMEQRNQYLKSIQGGGFPSLDSISTTLKGFTYPKFTPVSTTPAYNMPDDAPSLSKSTLLNPDEKAPEMELLYLKFKIDEISSQYRQLQRDLEFAKQTHEFGAKTVYPGMFGKKLSF